MIGISIKIRSHSAITGRGGLLRTMLALLMIFSVTALNASGSERFLERLSVDKHEGQSVLTVHFTQNLQYISHTPDSQGTRVTIRFRRHGTPASTMINKALGEGTKLLKPAPGQLTQVVSVTADGNLDMDPAIIVDFSLVTDFKVQPGPDARSIKLVIQNQSSSEAGKEGLVPEQPEFTGTSTEDKRIEMLFPEARKSIQAGNYQRATAIYDKIIAAGREPYTEEAILALAIARSENGQTAQAKAQFERYLSQYPDSPKTARVQRYLDALLAREKTAKAGAGASAQRQWMMFGTFDQFYLYDGGTLDDGDSDTYRSSLLTSANMTWQGTSGNMDISGRFSGSYDYSFLDERDHLSQVSYFYLDLSTRDSRHEGRIGRQRLSGSGVLGYFDGLHYQYKPNDLYAIRYAGGWPVRSSREGIDTDYQFHGLAVDRHAEDDSWFISLYALNQTVEGDTDRRALGTETRYFGDTYTLYGLLDYDIHFDELNIFHLLNNWRFATSTVVSLTADYRRSPMLALSNAALGQATLSLDQLQLDYSDDELEQLALDNSLLYKSLYLSVTQQLNDQWQLSLDGGAYDLSSDDSTSTTADTTDSSNWYLYSQLVANNLYTAGDVSTIGLRYSDSDRVDTTSILFRTRVPVKDRWLLTPRLRLDARNRDSAGDQWRVMPSLFTTYRINKRVMLEMDLGLEYNQTDEYKDSPEQDDRFYYLNLGYRYDF